MTTVVEGYDILYDISPGLWLLDRMLQLPKAASNFVLTHEAKLRQKHRALYLAPALIALY